MMGSLLSFAVTKTILFFFKVPIGEHNKIAPQFCGKQINPFLNKKKRILECCIKEIYKPSIAADPDQSGFDFLRDRDLIKKNFRS